MFSQIFQSFSKNWIIHQPKRIFFKIIFCFFLRSVFILIYDFNQAFWLNLIILFNFLKTNPWLILLYTNFKKISFITFFVIVFYKIFIKLRSIFDLLKIVYSKLLRHCPFIYIISIPILKAWWFFIFIIIFHVFVISFCISINRMAYSTSNTFFYNK